VVAILNDWRFVVTTFSCYIRHSHSFWVPRSRPMLQCSYTCWTGREKRQRPHTLISNLINSLTITSLNRQYDPRNSTAKSANQFSPYPIPWRNDSFENPTSNMSTRVPMR
jgi:hypothetical protein